MAEQVCFTGGDAGAWRVTGIVAVAGPTLPLAARLAVGDAGTTSRWTLRGSTSNQRYASRMEDGALRASQDPLGRPAARRAALIPIRKTEAWWALPQDERLALFAQGHVAVGMDALPAIARRLLHSRDMNEPFDFLTWFEYAPEHEDAFATLLARLRATPEWAFVDREVEIRLERLD